jgi:hypothetical protein
VASAAVERRPPSTHSEESRWPPRVSKSGPSTCESLAATGRPGLQVVLAIVEQNGLDLSIFSDYC